MPGKNNGRKIILLDFYFGKLLNFNIAQLCKVNLYQFNIPNIIYIILLQQYIKLFILLAKFVVFVHVLLLADESHAGKVIEDSPKDIESSETDSEVIMITKFPFYLKIFVHF